MQIDRTTIITGPALVTFGGQTFWSKGDITLKPVVEKFDIPTSSFGSVDKRIRDKRFEVTFEPEGRFTTALLAVLYPYAATNIGASIYGSTDRALVIHSRSGIRVTLHNAALTTLPSLRFAVGSTITGSVTFTALLKKDTDTGSGGAYFAVASATYPGDSAFSSSAILTRGYTATWLRATTDVDLPTREGWEIAFDLSLEPVIVDGIGTVDMRLSELRVTASCIPVGLSEEDILTSMQHAQVMGSSIQDSQALEIAAEGGGAFFSMPNVALVESDLGWGAQRNRTGTCTWEAVRRIVSGVPEPLFYIGEDEPA
jgi:hypothetical protein